MVNEDKVFEAEERMDSVIRRTRHLILLLFVVQIVVTVASFLLDDLVVRLTIIFGVSLFVQFGFGQLGQRRQAVVTEMALALLRYISDNYPGIVLPGRRSDDAGEEGVLVHEETLWSKGTNPDDSKEEEGDD